ncbi:TetR/AcrR family transcriptional regulator, partial [Mycolicibacterium sp. CBMA 361]
MAGPRERMIVSAALLIRERGAQSTAISDVLAHSGAPRGSAYHHFPGGRTQLLCEAIDYASEYIARRIAAAGTAIEALDALIEGFRTQLTDSGFRAGCPVAAVAVEADNPSVIERAAAAFTRWLGQLETQLR